jgi:hypothetical protein
VGSLEHDGQDHELRDSSPDTTGSFVRDKPFWP